jgi:hypothetical protein
VNVLKILKRARSELGFRIGARLHVKGTTLSVGTTPAEGTHARYVIVSYLLP